MLVMRTDNHYDYVKDFMLDSLIKSKQIVKFKLNAEWVNVGSDSIRGIKQERVLNGSNSKRLAINDSIFIREYRRANQ